MKIIKVTEGAYFVPSYSDQTIQPFQPSITNQTVISTDRESGIDVANGDQDVFAKDDFESKSAKHPRRR